VHKLQVIHQCNDTHLRAQFIRGIRDDDIGERLLQPKEDVTLAKVVELAFAIVTAKLESRQIQNPRSEANVHQAVNVHIVTKKWPNPHSTHTTTNYNAVPSHFFGKCFRCGNETHKADKCKYINAVWNHAPPTHINSTNNKLLTTMTVYLRSTPWKPE
jgi:hypothetical protein